jgi:hypothetical protein
VAQAVVGWRGEAVVLVERLGGLLAGQSSGGGPSGDQETSGDARFGGQDHDDSVWLGSGRCGGCGVDCAFWVVAGWLCIAPRAILIARAEPENSILEVVQAWSRKPRGCKLVVLGKYEASHAYQRAVQAAASAEVIFPGAIYEKPVVQALRFHARFYVHGHQVEGLILRWWSLWVRAMRCWRMTTLTTVG